MQQIDNSLLDELVEIIYQRIEEKFKKQLTNSNVEFSYDGIVRSIDSVNNTANIELGFGVVENLPNLTGDTISVNDKVRIFYNKSNLGTGYIGVKF